MNDGEVRSITKAILAIIIVASMIAAIILSLLGVVKIPAEGMGAAGLLAGWLFSEAKTILSTYFKNGNSPSAPADSPSPPPTS